MQELSILFVVVSALMLAAYLWRDSRGRTDAPEQPRKHTRLVPLSVGFRDGDPPPTSRPPR